MKALTKQEISSSAAAQTTHESRNKYAPTSFVDNNDEASSITKDKGFISKSFRWSVLKTATLALDEKEPTTSETIEINMKSIYSQNKKPDSQQRIESIRNDYHPTVTKAREIVKSALRTETRKLPANKPSSLKLAQSTIKQNEDAKTLVSIRDIDYHYDPEDNVAEQHKQTSTGMVAGIVVGIIVVVVVSLVLVYLLVSKKTDPGEDSDCLNDNDNETEFETSNSTESFDEYGTTYVTQENTNTIWGTDQKETDIGFFNDDFEEVECFN